MIRVAVYILLALALPAHGDVLFGRGSTWRWRPGTNEASTPVTAWRATNFNDGQFTSAPAPFWYGDPYDGGTHISGMQNVYLCLFLRKAFVITNLAEIESLQLGAIVDDGFVAWINGVEVQRVNMPTPTGTPVTISTLANNAVEPVPFVTYDLPPPASYLVRGTNVIAVQVIQSSFGSSDIGFDASLETVLKQPPPDFPPAVAAALPPASTTVRSLTEITLLFNKPVQGVDAADLLMNGAPATSVTAITPSQYVFHWPQSPLGAVEIAWAAGQGIHDADTPSHDFAGGSWTYRVDPAAGDALPYISEFMASNKSTLADENGDYSDWIEIYNPGAGAVNLEGWALTDTTNNLAKWRFPATNLAGGSFLVVFASEKDRRTPGGPLHTNFKLAAEGEYLALVQADGTTATSEFAPTFPVQVADVSYGIPQLGDPPFFTSGTNTAYFLRPTPGEGNVGGTDAPGPAILNVRHSPNTPMPHEDLRVTARIAPSFYSVGEVSLHYRIMFENEVTIPMFDDGAHDDGAANDGIYGALIPSAGLAAGQMVRYSVSAADVTGRPSRWPLFLDAASPEYLGTVVNPGYVTSAIPVIHLFAPANILQPGPNTSALGADSQAGSHGVSVFYDGEFYDNVYAALRGNTTAGYPKKSHRFEFPREHPFRHPGAGYGWPDQPAPRIRKTSFEADYPDPTYMRQGMSFWLCRQAGSPSSFYYPVRLQLNGAFYQLASHSDVQTEELLARLGYDPNGALYNAVGTVQPSQFSTGGFEKKTRRWEGNGDYLQLANAISESLTIGARQTNVFDMLDLPNVIDYLVAARFAQENDDVWANMSLYHDNDGDNLWRIISFDMNLSWGAFFLDNSANDLGIQATNDNHKSFPLYGSSQALSLTSGNYNRIYDVIFDIPQTLEMFRRRMRTVLDSLALPPGSPANTSPIEKKVLAWRDLIVPEAALDRAKWGWPGIGGQNNLPPASLADGVNDLLQKFFNLRRQHFYGKHSVTNTALSIGSAKTQNAGFPLSQPADSAIAIAGVDFNPVSGNQDQEFICLTNSASITLDISGWQVEGAVDFTFAPGTVVPAGGSCYLSPNVRAFRARTLSPKGREGHFVVGPYSGQLSARGATLRVRNLAGDIVHTFTYAGAPTLAQQFLRVTEIMYHPAAVPGDLFTVEDYEYLALKNISTNIPLNLSGIRFTNGISFNFTGSTTTQLAPGATVFLARNPAAFLSRYGNGRTLAGQYGGALDNSGERIRLLDPSGEEILDFHYRNDWHPETDGGGPALVVVDENAAPDTWSQQSNWKAGGSGTLDSDGDGLPDDWERRYGLNPFLADANLDSDSDGQSNLAEYIAGTNPVDPASCLKLKFSLDGAATSALEFQSVAGHSYSVEFTDSLGKQGWQKLIDFGPDSVDQLRTARDSFGGSNRFYRLVTPKR